MAQMGVVEFEALLIVVQMRILALTRLSAETYQGSDLQSGRAVSQIVIEKKGNKY